eukprot:m.231332 g.231332  ORF g.231332 m.231332 type:complete len:629 (+) comp12198_c0_seq1:540-2426(+)
MQASSDHRRDGDKGLIQIPTSESKHDTAVNVRLGERAGSSEHTRLLNMWLMFGSPTRVASPAHSRTPRRRGLHPAIRVDYHLDFKKNMAHGVAAVVLALAALACAQTTYQVFYQPSTQSYYTQPPFPGLAGPAVRANDVLVLTGSIANDTSKTGWYRLALNGEKGAADNLMMTGAGFLEGLLTSPLIDDAIANYAMDTSNKTLMDDLKTWFNTWGNWMRSQAVKQGSSDPYWRHVGLIFNQLDGLVVGHNKACNAPCTPLGFVDIMLLSPSVMDIITIISGQSPEWSAMTPQQALLTAARRTHCSGLIRRTSDGDVYLGHTTWNMYTGMVRIFKSYNFPLAAPQTRANIITFSSYPGALYSGDDFIMMPDTQLVVSETTNDIFNNSLYGGLQPRGTVITWLRSMVASRMAATAPEWTQLFAKYNSGTYNNQYMVVDYKLVKAARGYSLPADTLWIIEQIPNYTHAGDVTGFLNRNDREFWPSYNIPYFTDIFALSGYPTMAQSDPQFDYHKCARAQIFARDAPHVHDLEAMRNLMQSNNYATDPLSLGNPGNAISSRFDLSTGKDAFTVGGIDSKIVSLDLLAANNVWAISGPTHESLAPFSWTGPWAQFPHAGMPTTFNYNYTLISF